jgi:hypothetical protein
MHGWDAHVRAKIVARGDFVPNLMEYVLNQKRMPMKMKLIKLAAAAGLVVVSTAAFAATNGCCGSIECCLKMLAACC